MVWILLAAKGGEGLANLALSPTKLIAQFASFLIFLYLVNRFLFQPILQSLEERRRAIEQKFAELDRLREENARLQKDLQERLQRIEEERRQAISEAVKEGERIRENLRRKAEEEIHRLREKFRVQMEVERRQLLKEVREELVNVAVHMAERLLREKMDPRVHDKLLDEFLKEHRS